MKVLSRNFAVAKDLHQKAGADAFRTMNRDDRGAAVRMAKEMMTSLDAQDVKPRAGQCGNEDATTQSGRDHPGSGEPSLCNRDPLHSYKIQRFRVAAFDFQIQFDSLANSIHQFVERLGLGVAPGK